MSHQSNDSAVAIGCFLLTMVMVIIFWLATAAAAQATPQQNPCAPTANVTKMLKDKYGETPAVASITDDNAPMLIFSNPKTGTFTITIRRPGGITCLMTGGNSWTLVEQPKEGTDI
jgi:hypothetical protein